MAPRIVLAQLRPQKSDYSASLRQLGELFGQLAQLEHQPDVLVLPETALTGYILQGGVLEQARTASQLFQELQTTYLACHAGPAPALDVVLGFYERWRDRCYNSALYATLGSGSGVDAAGVKHVHRKVFLPTYGLYDEARFVESGRQIAAFDTRFGRSAVLICEDAWHSLSATIAALDGAQVLYIVSATAARGAAGQRPANLERWEELARAIAGEHGIFVALCQLVGFEGGKGLLGGSLIVGPRGDLRCRAPLWRPALLQADLDLRDLAQARAAMPLLGDLEDKLPALLDELRAALHGEPRPARLDAPAPPPSQPPPAAAQLPTPAAAAVAPPSQLSNSTGQQRAEPPDSRLPLITAPALDAQATAALRINAELVAEWLERFVYEELLLRRGFKQAVVGLSGGVDSAVTAYLCARALGPHNVLAVRMPYRSSSRTSLEHAQLVVDQLGLQALTIDISPAVDGYLQLVPEADARRRGNVMARTRMLVLFDQAARLGGLPVGTGNKTERLLGYYTWHGDDAPPVNPLGDLFKTQVWELARYLGVPDVIVQQPPSADLLPGQTDEADLGISYDRADRILALLLEGYQPGRLVEHGFVEQEVQLVARRLNATHWKRQLPTSAVLSGTAIGEYYLRPVDY